MITMQQFYRMFGVLCALLASGARIDAAKPARPNVLFVVADDLRTNLGCYGDPAAKTPNLDRLAGRGLLFERAYAQQSLCNPSRASAMTGRRPDTLRVWDLRTHFRETIPDVVTLPQMFRASGYFAQAIGKVYHNGDTKIHGDPASWSVPETLGWGSHGRDLAQVPENTAPSAPLTVSRSESRDVADEAYLDGRVARSAIEALRGFATKRESFFLETASPVQRPAPLLGHVSPRGPSARGARHGACGCAGIGGRVATSRLRRGRTRSRGSRGVATRLLCVHEFP